ncbi:MAG TPA: MogA/MoaB family molybdenum cofactor biosynthesis protein [Thermoplasmata archaeon]|jgi:molybdenum cofactor biosynthesis protein B|nr:MogA/MoaB family molybdenum cofactor biosynthesis protein [Thermoplasmata archaeon]
MNESPGSPRTTSRHHLHGDRSLGFGVLSVSDTHTEQDDPSGHLARDLLQKAGHKVVHYTLVANSVADVRERLEPWLGEVGVEAAVTVGGTGVSSRDLTVNALDAMGGRKLEGFGEIYRSLSFDEVGPLAMISRASLFVIQGKPVFALPGSERAVRTAIEKLIVPAAVHLVEELER